MGVTSTSGGAANRADRARERQTRRRHERPIGPSYKWIALSNTTLGALMATINSSIILIALPAIFNGIHLDPLAPANASYFLWLLLGYNPIGVLIPNSILSSLPPADQATLLGKTFFPNLISAPFMVGLQAVFVASAVMCVIAAVASLLRGQRVIYGVQASAGALPAGANAATPAATAVLQPAESRAGYSTESGGLEGEVPQADTMQADTMQADTMQADTMQTGTGGVGPRSNLSGFAGHSQEPHDSAPPSSAAAPQP